ncbi:hypothetical protein [Streptomyces sulfonofaciens]|nr:hypothetical protein [Streptomyces sulfonofaciens]
MQLRDVTALMVPRVGRVEETGDPSLPYRLLDRDGIEVAAVSQFLLDMLADDDSPASLRSYAYELLAWFRFLWAVDVPWDRIGRAEARDFALWLKMVKKPPRPRRPDAPAPGSVNPVTGKRYAGENYAARTRKHARAVVRSFYEYHRDMHGRPLLNPFPEDQARRGRAPQRPPQPDARLQTPCPPGPLPAEGTPANPARHPRPGIQRTVRSPALAPRPRAGRLLHLGWPARLGTPRRQPRSGQPR